MDIEKAIQAVTATKEGIFLFRHLKQVCGFTQNSVVENKITGEANVYATVYNEGRRDVYNGLRQHIPYKPLIEIEIEKPEPLKIKERPKKDGRSKPSNDARSSNGNDNSSNT